MGLLALLDFLGPSGVIIAVVAVLLYGERLPDVAKTFGKQYLDLKKGIHSLREEFESVATGVRSHSESGHSSSEADHDREESTAPKFEPPPAEPFKDEPDKGHENVAAV